MNPIGPPWAAVPGNPYQTCNGTAVIDVCPTCDKCGLRHPKAGVFKESLEFMNAERREKGLSEIQYTDHFRDVLNHAHYLAANEPGWTTSTGSAHWMTGFCSSISSLTWMKDRQTCIRIIPNTKQAWAIYFAEEQQNQNVDLEDKP